MIVLLHLLGEFQTPPISYVCVASAQTNHGRKSAILYIWFDSHHF